MIMQGLLPIDCAYHSNHENATLFGQHLIGAILCLMRRKRQRFKEYSAVARVFRIPVVAFEVIHFERKSMQQMCLSFE